MGQWAFDHNLDGQSNERYFISLAKDAARIHVAAYPARDQYLELHRAKGTKPSKPASDYINHYVNMEHGIFVDMRVI